MSAGKCKRGPENPLGATSSSSSSDEDSPRRDVTGALRSPTLVVQAVQQPLQRRPVDVGADPHHQQQQQQQQLSSLSPAPAAPAQTSGLSATLPTGSTTAQQEFDAVDYDAASSPSGSSTLSSGGGSSLYIRQPGFTDHAHCHRALQSARRPQIKKKKKSAVRGDSDATPDVVDDVGKTMVTSTSLVSSTSVSGGSTVVVVQTEAASNGVDALLQQHQLEQGTSLTSRQSVVKPSVVSRSKPHRGRLIQGLRLE